MFSISVDYDCSNPASISGYASLWGWSRKRVSNFLLKCGLEIVYEGKFNRHKKGQVGYQVGNRWGTGGEQVEFIDSNSLRDAGNRRGTGGEQEGNRKGSTTSYPNPKPKPKNKNGSKFSPHALKPDDVDKQLWADFLDNRKFKKLQNTERALKVIIKAFEEGIQAGYTYEQIINRYVSSGMQRFKVEWMADNGKQNDKQNNNHLDQYALELLYDSKN